MTPAELVALLDAVPPHHLEAVPLLAELYALEEDGLLDSVALALLQGDITAAIGQLETHADQVKGVVERCCDLPAMPSTSTPLGF